MLMLDSLNNGENEKAINQFELLPFYEESLFCGCTEFTN